MIIQQISLKSIWNSFFDQNGSPSFLQSREWGELQEGLGYRVKRLGIYNDHKLQAIAQVIRIRSKRGNFLFIPHGPIFLISNIKDQIAKRKLIISQLLNFLITLAKRENYSFIRIAPILKDNVEKIGRA
ncbi:MAG: peptidoglycan bridge formation glycyltransferase FemA/FemB family protein, partial [Bacteroidetes bacterium]